MRRSFRVRSACLTVTLAMIGFASTGPVLAELSPLGVIEKSVEGYAQMEEFAGRVDFMIVFQDGRSQSKQLAYGWRGADAFQALLLPDGSRGLELVAAGGHLYASQFNVPNAYIDARYEDDLPAALESIGAGQVGLELSAPLAAALTGETSAFLKGLGFGVLGPLEVASAETVTGGEGTRIRVDLVADNGTCSAFFDPVSFELTGFEVVVGEQDHQVRGSGSFIETPVSELDSQLAFDALNRRAVSDFATLEASAYPLGEAAPIAPTRNLAGESVSLAEFRGSVVVLDFWATWCVPCWSALEEAEKLADWAQREDLPVAVFAVNTLEEVEDPKQRARVVNEFLESRELSLPVLIDSDNSFFAAMHTPGLPSTVVVAPDGTLARYHSGVMDDMAKALQQEIDEILGGQE